MAEAQPEGRRVASRYHLLEAIGRGGMGIVWRAHDEFLDREVAIKEVRYADMLGEDNQEDFNRRTKREARAAGRLTHPNVVVVHDVVEEDGRPWIVMQLVESRSLGKVMRQDGPLPPKRVAEIGLQLLDALRAAHTQGVLHRDVKPENVLLADDGRVVLTDFGIATLEAETALTMTGIAGTPAFIPPERIKGASAQRESDLWSLGATLYAAVEGKPPHDRGGALPTMHAILNDEPEPPARAGRLAPVLEGLLRKDPALRMNYAEAEGLLRAVAEGEEKPEKPARKRPAKTAVMPAVVAASATADTDPGARFQADDFPATGAKLGVAVPAPPKPPAPREEPREPAAKAPVEEAPAEDAGRKPEAERNPTPPARSETVSPERPKTAPPVQQGPVPAPRPEPAPSRPAPAPGGRPNPFPPVRQPVPAPRPEPAPRASEGFVPEVHQDGAGTLDPSSQMMTMTSQGGSRTPVKRGLLVILPALLIVGMVAGWLGLRSGQSTEEQATGPSQARPGGSGEPSGSGSGGSTGPAETTPESTPEQKPSPAPSPSPTPTKKKEESALPAGWHMHKDSNGFSVGLPKGWYVASRSGRQVRFRGPNDSVSYMMIEYVDKGGADPKKDWEKQEPYSRGNFPGYKRIRIEKVDYMVKAADWEFTWNISAGKARVINRGFIANKGGRGYAIYWHTLASDWKKNLPLFEGFAKTFSSKK
ncbi:serine/threonine-protein kinase [Streptosporangium lutulentum]|uniref:non-specific serine/threonine protein kinase n=1 Tax=Streptosporangium lutulentum TaxID=1461250 RepID=A0ABT9QFK7_9ACTN|nr:serine/threonine-protein kinase [Streptosporangium lutulentum]MDP9845088.1 tRNA A-37 threonylcarbamoyl transferase component Bud32 [Streptosporangium lutulentum]